MSGYFGGGGGGQSQSDTDARYLKIDGTTTGTGAQIFGGTVTSSTGVLASGAAGSVVGQLRLFNISGVRSFRLSASVPAAADRTIDINWSALTTTRTWTIPNGNIDFTPLVTPTGTGNAVLATAPAITNPTITGTLTGDGGNTGTLPLVTTGVVAPTTTPAAVGLIFIDTVLGKIYMSVGTSSSADWTLLN